MLPAIIIEGDIPLSYCFDTRTHKLLVCLCTALLSVLVSCTSQSSLHHPQHHISSRLTASHPATRPRCPPAVRAVSTFCKTQRETAHLAVLIGLRARESRIHPFSPFPWQALLALSTQAPQSCCHCGSPDIEPSEQALIKGDLALAAQGAECVRQNIS